MWTHGGLENEMIYTEQTKKAMKLCYEAHMGQVDKGGVPYVFHPWHLAEQMSSEESTVAALLHDVAEDTDISIEDMVRMGFSPAVIEALGLLCHDKDEPYMDYVERIKQNPIAREVKLADLRHNSTPGRLETMGEKDLLRIEKYKKAIELLCE